MDPNVFFSICLVLPFSMPCDFLLSSRPNAVDKRSCSKKFLVRWVERKFVLESYFENFYLASTSMLLNLQAYLFFLLIFPINDSGQLLEGRLYYSLLLHGKLERTAVEYVHLLSCQLDSNKPSGMTHGKAKRIHYQFKLSFLNPEDCS